MFHKRRFNQILHFVQDDVRTTKVKTAMKNLNENFQTQVIEKSHEKPVLVDFWAPWCGPCRVLGPSLEKLARESKGAWRLVKINADKHQDLVQQFGVRGIPAVKLFVAGEIKNEFVGALPEHAIRQWLAESLPYVND